MRKRHKLLLVDDDQDLLDLYREIFSQLPSRPEISTASSGARAIAMLEAEPFTLLVCDLNMPKMDGLQVLSIVRRKYPDLRTVVLTSMLDEQFRSRVYSLGVDMYWQKPATTEEIQQFLECMESLLGREASADGFRGIQSKSLVDIIQLECLSQNSTVLKIINGPLIGKIWIQDGEVTDAATDGMEGEKAFHKILSWKSGNFESLPAEPDHPRVIFNSYQGLLLETAQAQDEALGQAEASAELPPDEMPQEGAPGSPLATSARFPGVEFVLTLKSGPENSFEVRGLENAKPVADWSRQSLETFRALGERLKAGPLQQLEGAGHQQHLLLAPGQKGDLCVGWQRNLTASHVQEGMKKLIALWGS